MAVNTLQLIYAVLAVLAIVVVAFTVSRKNTRLGKGTAMAIIAGVLYGILIRLGAGHELIKVPFFEIISYSFLFITPIGVGALSVYIASKETPLSVGEQITISVKAMTVFLITMFVFLLEGLICIVLIVPVFMLAAILGGLIMGLVIKYTKKQNGVVKSLLILPLLLNPIEGYLGQNVAMSHNRVADEIIINASPEDVFAQLAAVKLIKKEELGFSFMHAIGMPRPLEAAMSDQGLGAVRTSKWEKGIQFEEKITVWDAPYHMHYEFNIPAGSIPREALDRHVELGGEYFTVLDGGYDIERLADNRSKLVLRTRYENKSRLQKYGNAWAALVLHDFHRSLLQLMKTRAESS